LRSRALRRLVVALAALVVIDLFEPAVLRSLEEARYEDPARDFRFENSDLFGLGPLVAYLREHPRGRQPRVLFLGNSVIFGYELSASDAVPARYQRFDGSAKVFNAAINGLSTASSLVIARAAVDSVDLTYALLGPIEAPVVLPILPRLIPVDDADLAQFHLPAPNRIEQLLAAPVNRWRLYRDGYRLQAALFGSSTRQFVYLHKGALARGLIARVRAEQPSRPLPEETVTITEPMADAVPDAARQLELRAQRPELWQFGDLARSRRKPIVLLQVEGHSKPLLTAAMADFNRVFAPQARVLFVRVPPQLTMDGMHVTSTGAVAFARALRDARLKDSPR